MLLKPTGYTRAEIAELAPVYLHLNISDTKKDVKKRLERRGLRQRQGG